MLFFGDGVVGIKSGGGPEGVAAENEAGPPIIGGMESTDVFVGVFEVLLDFFEGHELDGIGGVFGEVDAFAVVEEAAGGPGGFFELYFGPGGIDDAVVVFGAEPGDAVVGLAG